MKYMYDARRFLNTLEIFVAYKGKQNGTFVKCEYT
jgi:hypothetical protein